jgi:hypothetical protein
MVQVQTGCQSEMWKNADFSCADWAGSTLPVRFRASLHVPICIAHRPACWNECKIARAHSLAEQDGQGLPAMPVLRKNSDFAALKPGAARSANADRRKSGLLRSALQNSWEKDFP